MKALLLEIIFQLIGSPARRGPQTRYPYSADGAESFQPGATPQEKSKSRESGLKARPIVPAIDRLPPTINRTFSATDCKRHDSWGVAPGWNNDAPLALNTYETRGPQRASLPRSRLNHQAVWKFILSIALTLLCGTLAHAQNVGLRAQPTPNRAPSADSIHGKLQRFDQTPHVAVPVQLLDRSNHVVQTKLSDEAGGYSFTNVPPGMYRIRCHVLGGFRYHGLDRIVHGGTLTNAGPEVAGVPALTLQAGAPIESADFTFAPFKKGTWKTYNFRDGLAGSELQRILPLDDGTVWIATKSGLAIFDGATFTYRRKEDGLLDSRIINLHRETNGTIWICTGIGVARFDPAAPPGKQFRGYSSAESGLAFPVHAVCQTPDGAMWFAQENGLTKFDGRKFAYVNQRNRIDPSITKLTASPDGILWLATTAGLRRFDGTNFTTITTGYCHNLIVGPDGGIWFGSNQGLWRYDPSPDSIGPSRFRNYTTRDGLISDAVLVPFFAPDGVLWIGTRDGLSRFDGTNFVNFTTADGAMLRGTVAITSTSDGMLWFGTIDGGLVRYDPHSFENYTMADGLAYNYVNNAHRLPDGRLWVGSEVRSSHPVGLNQFADGKFTEVPLPDGDTGAIDGIRVRAEGVYLVGDFKHAWAYRVEGTNLVSAVTTADFKARRTSDIVLEKDGTIWLAQGAAGLLRARRGSGTDQGWELHRFVGGGFDSQSWLKSPSQLERDDQGRIWAGGLTSSAGPYDGEKWGTFSKIEGLAGEHCHGIWKDTDGSLWFATERGAAHFNGKTIDTLTSVDDRLADDWVRSVKRDSQGVLWFGTLGGATRFDGQVWASLDSLDGLAGDQVNHVLADADGTFWFSTDRGVTHYRPRRGEAPLPRVSMILDATNYAAGATLPQIEQGRSVRFKLDVNDLRTRAETRRFRYQVVSERKSADDFGNTNGWRLTGKASEISWSTNKSGAFTLAVQYIDRDFHYSKLEVIPLTVFTPWYANAFVMAPGGGAVAGLVVWAFIARVLVSRRKLESERLRERLLEEEHQAHETLEAKNAQLESAKIAVEGRKTKIFIREHSLVFCSRNVCV